MAEATDNRNELSFESEQEKTAFKGWLESVAGEMDSLSGSFYDTDDAVTWLTDPEDGYLAPDSDKGFPNFYDFPYTDQVRADDFLYYLYSTAFAPDAEIDAIYGRTDATVLTYPSVWDIPRGEASCVGLLVSRRPRHNGPGARELPDTLLFRASYLYISDLACQDEQALLDLYRLIMNSRLYNPTPSLWERLKHLFARQ